MEDQSFPEILSIVQDILSTSPLTTQNDNTTPILPKSISPLPESSLTLLDRPLGLDQALDRLKSDVLPYLNKASLSPHYYGFVTGGVTPAAQIGDILASIFDQNTAVHLPADTIATNVEVAALNMLSELFYLLPREEWAVGTPGNGGGILTTGATASNVLGLALGREYVLANAAKRTTDTKMSVGQDGLMAVSSAARIDQIKILSTMPHSSIAKAASIVGLGRNCVVSVVKEGHYLDIDLERIRDLANNAAAGRTGYIVALSAGEVNTGHFASNSMTQMRQLREICDEHGIWLHVDGAFGLFARLLIGHAHEQQEYQKITDGVKGLELADSITADGHKLLNVPYDSGIFFTRHKQLSIDVFQNGGAPYLTSSPAADPIQSPLNIGIENSRRFRALPVYTTLLAHGRADYTALLTRQITLARQIARYIRQHAHYELLPPDQPVDKIFVIVLFCARHENVNQDLAARINASGRIYVSGTVWEGRKAVRIAVSNWRVRPERDLEVVKEVLDSVV